MYHWRWHCLLGWSWCHIHGKKHEVYSITDAVAVYTVGSGATDSASTDVMFPATGAVLLAGAGAQDTSVQGLGMHFFQYSAHWRWRRVHIGMCAIATAGTGATYSTLCACEHTAADATEQQARRDIATDGADAVYTVGTGARYTA